MVLKNLRIEALSGASHQERARVMVPSIWWIAVIFPVLVVSAEMTASFISVPLGTALHAVLLVVLLAYFIRMDERTDWPTYCAIPVLALLPLMRVISVAMPVGIVDQLYWPFLVGTPVLFAAILLSHTLNLTWNRSGISRRFWLLQAAIATSGLPLGLIAYFIAQPDPLAAGVTWFDFILGSIILVIFSALVEEIIFRGMLQQIAVQLFGIPGILWSSVLFAAMYIGSLSGEMVLFMLAVGLLFSLYVYWTDSIWGVVLAHSVFKIGLLLVYPGPS